MHVAALDDTVKLEAAVLVDGGEGVEAKTAQQATGDGALWGQGDGRRRDRQVYSAVLRLGAGYRMRLYVGHCGTVQRQESGCCWRDVVVGNGGEGKRRTPSNLDLDLETTASVKDSTGGDRGRLQEKIDSKGGSVGSGRRGWVAHSPGLRNERRPRTKGRR